MMRINDSTEFKRLVRAGTIRFGGNRKLMIYGALRCRSGKRMKKSNRVFFSSIEDAESSGFRPCGKCLRKEYRLWKAGPSASSGTALRQAQGPPFGKLRKFWVEIGDRPPQF